MIGHKYDGAERVVIIEDVITAGTSVRESMEILAANHNPKVAGVVVSVDRRERGQGDLSAIEEVKQEFGLPVFAIATVEDIIAHLHGREIDGVVHIDDATREKMEQYLKRYGVLA